MTQKLSLIVFSHTHERNVKQKNIPVRCKLLACQLRMLHNEQVEEEEEPGPESEGRGRVPGRSPYCEVQWVMVMGNGHMRQTLPPPLVDRITDRLDCQVVIRCQ